MKLPENDVDLCAAKTFPGTEGNLREGGERGVGGPSREGDGGADDPNPSEGVGEKEANRSRISAVETLSLRLSYASGASFSFDLIAAAVTSSAFVAFRIACCAWK